MNLKHRLEVNREEILQLAAKYGSYNLRVFGLIALPISSVQWQQQIGAYQKQAIFLGSSFLRSAYMLVGMFPCVNPGHRDERSSPLASL